MTKQIENNVKKVKTLEIYLIVLFFCFTGFFFIIGSSLFLSFFSELQVSLSKVWGTLVFLASLILGFLMLVSCYGLWGLVDWGRTLSINVCILSIILMVVPVDTPFKTKLIDIIMSIIFIAICVVIIRYLLKEDVKSLFSGAKKNGSLIKETQPRQSRCLENVQEAPPGFCFYCGEELSDPVPICPKCGKKLV